MPDIRCRTAQAWLDGITQHGARCGHIDLLWHDTVGVEYGLYCPCGSRFILDAQMLRAEAIENETAERLLRQGLSTQKGKQALMDNLRQTIQKLHSTAPKIAWDLIGGANQFLDDD